MSKKNKAEPFHMISKTVTDVIPVEDTDDEEENTTGFVVNATKPEEDTEDGGSVTDIFQPLRMTESGKKNMDRYQDSKRRSRNRTRTNDLNIDKDFIELVKEGKYAKAMAVKPAEIDSFIDLYMNNENKSTNANATARTIIQIAKSFYEYNGGDRNFISDNLYDGLLSAYLSTGGIEPNGFVPKGNKNVKRVDIQYPSLHNNMDKSYIIHEGDSVPTGVKETNSVEGFLTRVYTDLGMTANSVIQLELSPKIDGVSVNGTLSGGRLLNPQTRGDDGTSVALDGLSGIQMCEKPSDIPSFGIQYECFVTEEARRYASAYLGLEDPYVSCRHAAAGITRRLSANEDPELLQYLSFYPIATENLDGTYEERTDLIQNFGIIPTDMIPRKIISGNMSNLLKEIENAFSALEMMRPSLSFAIDGMIITVVVDEYQEIIGRSGRTNKWQIAIKFDPANAKATVAGVHLDTGKKGYRTIQVDLKEAVFLDGVRYDHVPVASIPIFESMDLRVGTEVSIHRVGDTIPSISILKVGEGSRIKTSSMKCPSCGVAMTTKAQKFYCDNPDCHANVIGKLITFFDQMGMSDYGASFASELVTKMGVTNFMDLFDLDEWKFANAGITSQKAKQFAAALRSAFSYTPPYNILTAMAIPEVGIARARQILQEFTLSDIIRMNRVQITALVESVPGISNKNAVLDYLMSTRFKRDVVSMLPYLKASANTVVATPILRIGHSGGKLSDEALELCKKKNFEVVDGKKFDVLIVPTHDQSSKKTEKANENRLPIMTEAEFMQEYDIFKLRKKVTV